VCFITCVDTRALWLPTLLQDHALPDLIWNQQTRGELRASLDAELREVGGALLPFILPSTFCPCSVLPCLCFAAAVLVGLSVSISLP
jgi:hypothetical protein